MTAKGPQSIAADPAAETGDVRRRRFRALHVIRERARRLPGGGLAWRICIALLGLVIVVVGVILLPLPGPGWLIIFVGLGVWSTEFKWAERLLRYARRHVHRWTDWAMRQPRFVQSAIAAAGLVLLVGGALATWWVIGRF
ncbi:MAG: TIGR02611 family protein [Actinomycetota bacterium]